MISLLSKLEPLLGLALTLNFAYLALPRFRYRQRMRSYVSEHLRSLDKVPPEYEKTIWYVTLVRISAISVGDFNKGEGSSKDFPTEIWCRPYKLLFERHLDIWLVGFLTLVLSSLIIFSVGQTIDLFGFSKFLFTQAHIHWWFTLIVLSGVTPVFLVWWGRTMVDGCKKYADANTQSMMETMKKDVANLQTPDI